MSLLLLHSGEYSGGERGGEETGKMLSLTPLLLPLTLLLPFSFPFLPPFWQLGGKEGCSEFIPPSPTYSLTLSTYPWLSTPPPPGEKEKPFGFRRGSAVSTEGVGANGERAVTQDDAKKSRPPFSHTQRAINVVLVPYGVGGFFWFTQPTKKEAELDRRLLELLLLFFLWESSRSSSSTPPCLPCPLKKCPIMVLFSVCVPLTCGRVFARKRAAYVEEGKCHIH